MSEPYYADEFVTLYHGDCRVFMPSLSWDSVITDPPYGTGYYPTDTDVFTPPLLASLAGSGPCAVFGYPEWLVGLCVEAGIVPSEWVTWWASNAATKSAPTRSIARETECIAIFGKVGSVKVPRSPGGLRQDYKGSKQRGTSNGDPASRYASDVWTDAAPGVGFHHHLRQHPNEKPLSVGSKLVQAVGGACILDPFAGSGTFLIAAKQAGRKAIGIELVEEHCDTAAKRLAQGVLDFGVFL